MVTYIPTYGNVKIKFTTSGNMGIKMVRERGSGKTPERVVELLSAAVKEKSILAVHKATGIGLAAIGRYLKGIGEPTTATLQKLSDYSGVSVAWLRGEERKTPTLVVELLKKDSEKFDYSGLKPITIKLLLDSDAEPNETTLEALSDYYCVSVARLRGDAPDKYSEILLNFKQEVERLAEYIGTRDDIPKDTKLSVFEAASDLEDSIQALMDKIS